MALSMRARRRRVILATVVLVAIVAVTGAWVVREQMISSRIATNRAAGMEAYERGDWALAMNQLGYVVSRSPDDVEATVALASSRRSVPSDNNKHLAVAISLAREAHTRDRSVPEPLELLVDLYLEVGLHVELIDAAEKLLAIRPGHQTAAWGRALSLYRTADQRAEEALNSFIAEFPDDYRGHALMLDQMVSLGVSAEEALAYADEQLALHPEIGMFFLLYVETAARVRDEGVAFEEIRARAMSAPEFQDTDDPQVLVGLVRVYDDLGLSERADALLEDALLDEGSPLPLIVATERDWMRGRSTIARETLSEAISDADTAHEGLLGWWLFLSELTGDELREHPYAVELAGRDGEVVRFWKKFHEGAEQLKASRLGEARESFELALQIGFEHEGFVARPIAEYLLGLSLIEIGQWREGIALWKQTAERHPQWLTLWIELAQMCGRYGELDEARIAAVNALARAPESYAAARTAASVLVVLLESGDESVPELAELDRLLEHLTPEGERRSSEEHAYILSLRARTSLARGETETAREIIREVLSSGFEELPANLMPLVDRAHAANIPEARTLASTIRGSGALYHQVVERRARESLGLGHIDDAIDAYQTAIESASAEETGMMLRRGYVRLLQDAGRPEEATRVAAALAEEHPDTPLLQIELLNTPSAWEDERMVEAAITRLRAVSGPEGALWRIFEARRLIDFEPSEAKAAEAMLLLGPVVRGAHVDPSALVVAGRSMLLLEDEASAVEYLSRALDEDPERAVLYPRVIQLFRGLGLTDLADARLDDFVSVEDLSDDLRRARADLLKVSGRHSEALADWHALGAQPSAPTRDQVMYGVALSLVGDVDAATETFNRVLVDPRSGGFEVSSAAEFFDDAGDRQRAIAALRQGGNLSDIERARRLSAFYSLRGMYDEAQAELESAIAMSGDGGEAEDLVSLARVLLAADEIDRADEVMSQVEATHPGAEGAATLRSMINLQRGEAVPQDVLASMVEDLDGRDADPAVSALVRLTLDYYETNDEQRYVAALGELVDEHPSYMEGWRLYITTLVQDGRLDEAVRAADVARRQQRADAAFLALATEVYLIAQEHTKARSTADSWLRVRGVDRLGPMIELARLDLIDRRPGDAYRRLVPFEERLIAEAAEAPGAVEIYASAAALSGETEKAMESLESLIASQSDGWMDVFVRVGERVAGARPRAARDWLERSAELARGVEGASEAVLRFAFVLASATGEERDFVRVVELAPSGENAGRPGHGSVYVAFACERLGRLDDAETWYRTALKASPNEPAAPNNLAFLLLLRDGDSAEAVRLAEQAVSLAEEGSAAPRVLATYLHTLGEALLAEGRAADALPVLLRGIEGDPRSSDLMLALAEAHADLDNKEAAVDVLRRLRQSAGTFADDPERRARVDAISARVSG